MNILQLAILTPTLLFMACNQTTDPPSPTSDVPVQPEVSAAQAAFANSPTEPPPDWKGRVFSLSADYPTSSPPACTPETCPWLSIEVDWGTPDAAPDWSTGKWAAYMNALKDYIRQGQADDFPDLSVTVDGATRWYHVPWMAYDPTVGRDFVHGTTNERTSFLSDLLGDAPHPDLADGIVDDACASEWKKGFETWAVGVYNPYGGYAIGQAIPRQGPNAGVPQTTSDATGRTLLAGLPFPEGTVVAKFLTTNAPPECVPYLAGSPEWQIDRHTRNDDGTYTCNRAVQTSRIVQVDVAAVDSRSPTRWVYGTFVYNGTLPGDTFWDKLQPLGAQWGSDNAAYPAVKDKDAPIVQTSLNPAVNIYEHQGCHGRLAGPVDNRMSSCISCHGGGFAPPVGTIAVMGTNEPPIFGFDGMCAPTGDDQYALNAWYFHDSVYPEPYGDPKYADTIPLDTSLQLQVALSQYALFATNGAPNACLNGD